MTRLEPRAVVESGYDALVERYRDWAGGTADPGREELVSAFIGLLPEGARVLDLGCGAGLPSTALLAERFDVTGVDLSAKQLDLAGRNVPTARFVRGDIATIDLPEGTWDGAVALYSLTHVPRTAHAAVLRRLASWLVPGGVLLATLGGRDGPDWTGDWLGQPMFFSSFAPDVSRGLLRDAGFELLVDRVIATDEPEGPVPFHWVLGRKRAARS